MRDSLKQYACAVLFLLYGGTAWAQDFNPDNPPDPQMLYKVVALATDGHYTSGSGSYTLGTQVTINTSASSTGFDFKHWTKNGVVYTTARSFTYTVENFNVNFVAVYEFNPDNPNDPQALNEYRLFLVPEPEDACSFSRTSGAKCEGGTNPTVTAYANQGFVFQGWYNGETKISESATLTTFTMPTANTTLTAKYIFNPTLPGDPKGNQENVDQGKVEGDMDGDGELSVTDVVLLVNAVMDSSGISDIKKYDMDGDGELSVTDVVILVNTVMSN